MVQINAILQNIQKLKAQHDELEVLANNEKAQIQEDEEKEQIDIKRTDEMIHDLNESIRQAEQQLRQIVSNNTSLTFVVGNRATDWHVISTGWWR